MVFFQILLFSAALSTDAFGIGVSCELRNIKAPVSARLIICLMSVLVTGAAVFIGSSVSGIVQPWIGKTVGSIMLSVLGIYVIYGALSDKEPKKKKPPKPEKENIFNFAVKPLGITVRIIRNPVECDMDNSSSIDITEACYIGLAISADSFAAGLGVGISGASGFTVPIMCGICQMTFLCCGIGAGKKLRNIKFIKQKYFSVISGIMLILIAILRIMF